MRECGPCTACCTALAIAELNKPTFQSCSHLCDTGCDIYARRPGSCADYQCLWLQGHLAEEDRPDLLGVIFTTTADPADVARSTLPMLVEYREGALASPRLQQAIEGLLRHRPVVVMTRAGRRVLQPVPLTVEGEGVA